MHECPKDYYFSIEEEKFMEGHILMTQQQSRYLEKAIKKRMLNLGYSKPVLVIEPGGEYDYALDEDDEEYDAYAAEIITDGGFTAQNWSTLKKEE